MDRFPYKLNVKAPINLTTAFKTKAGLLGFTISGAIRSLMRDFIFDKVTLTKYPDLNSKGRRAPPVLKQPPRRSSKSPQRGNGKRLTEGTEVSEWFLGEDHY